MKKSLKYQRGFGIQIAMIGVVIFLGCAVVAMQFRKGYVKTQTTAVQANAIAIVQTALQSYVDANKDVFRQGKTIMYINDQNAPTVQNLIDLGFLTSSGTNLTNPFGSGYATKVQYNAAANTITGLVYLTGNILNKKTGLPDHDYACAIARALGDSGLCTPPNNPSVLGHGAAQVPNPTNLPAVVGASVFVPAP